MGARVCVFSIEALEHWFQPRLQLHRRDFEARRQHGQQPRILDGGLRKVRAENVEEGLRERKLGLQVETEQRTNKKVSTSTAAFVHL